MALAQAAAVGGAQVFQLNAAAGAVTVAHTQDGDTDMQGRETRGMCRERLGRIEQFIDQTYVSTGKLPGALVQVWRRGELTLNTALGMADRERQVPLAEDSIFRIYSMTKPITSVAIMMLLEECKIALDDPVSKYIPAWENLGVFAGGFMESFQTRAPARPMLVVDLLRHTSGLTYGFQQNSNVDAAYRKHKLGDLAVEGTLDAAAASLRRAARRGIVAAEAGRCGATLCGNQPLVS